MVHEEPLLWKLKNAVSSFVLSTTEVGKHLMQARRAGGHVTVGGAAQAALKTQYDHRLRTALSRAVIRRRTNRGG